MLAKIAMRRAYNFNGSRRSVATRSLRRTTHPIGKTDRAMCGGSARLPVGLAAPAVGPPRWIGLPTGCARPTLARRRFQGSVAREDRGCDTGT